MRSRALVVIAPFAIGGAFCGQASAQHLTRHEARAASMLLAREWREEGERYGVVRCARRRCEAFDVITSYLGRPHLVRWEDGVIVTWRHGRICASWEGPTVGRACLR